MQKNRLTHPLVFVPVFGISAASLFFRSLGMRACRFYPSCSEYCKEAFMSRSFFEAALLSFKRFFRCHPFSQGGFDPLSQLSLKKDS